MFLSLAAILLVGEGGGGESQFSNFGRGSPKEYFSEIILKLGHLSRRRCHLKVFFFNFSSGGHFVHWSRTILAILVFGPLVKEEMSFKVFFFFSSGGHVVQQSRITLAILVDSHPGTFL